MPEVLLSNDDITVLGPPTNIDVLVDIGPTGIRGSQVFMGIGDPNTIEIGQTPFLNDLYINASADNNYSYLYQYRAEPGGNVWVKTIKLTPALYNTQQQVTFTDGVAQITLLVSEIYSGTGTVPGQENFNVQYSFIHSNPVSSSITSISVISNSLYIDLKAVENDSGTWQDLDGEIDMQLFISIMI